MLRKEDKEKIDAFFASLTKEQLTRKLTEAGVEFVKETKSEMVDEFNFNIIYSPAPVRCQAEREQYLFEADGAAA